jgi:hypothetical protein
MLPPVGIERDGVITLTRHVPVPPSLPGAKKLNPQGIEGSPITVRQRTLVLREVLNPLKYVWAAQQREEHSKHLELAKKSELDAAIDEEEKAREEWEKVESARSSAEPSARNSPAGPRGPSAPPGRIGRAAGSTSALARARTTTTSGASSPRSARASPSAEAGSRTPKHSGAPPSAFKTTRKRKRPTRDELERAAHEYGRQQTGMRIGLSHWEEYLNFIDISKRHIADIEREGGWLEEARARRRGKRPTQSVDGDV